MTKVSAQDREIISDWLNSLGVLCAGSMPQSEAVMRCSAFLTMIEAEFPISAFSKKSLAAVARQCKFFPSYGELVGYLSAWQRDQPANPMSLSGPAGPGLTRSERYWVGEWDKYVAEKFVSYPTEIPRQPGCGARNEDHQRAHLAAMIRHLSPRAWDHISHGA